MDLAQQTHPIVSETLSSQSSAGSSATRNDLKLVGTAALSALHPDDRRLVALRQACSLLETLLAEREALNQRLESANRLDPMRHASGRTSLDTAVEETRTLITQIDELLCSAAESVRTTSLTHPKDAR